MLPFLCQLAMLLEPQRRVGSNVTGAFRVALPWNWNIVLPFGTDF